MALFRKEPEKSPKIQPTAMPQGPATSPTTIPKGPTPSEGRTYLDRGSKITGKIFFDCPARIDGGGQR